MGLVSLGGGLAPDPPARAELWLGSGRQHQVYIERDERGVLRLSSRIWSTVSRTWLPMGLYQRGEPDMALAGCLNCHLSGVTYVIGHRGVVPAWTELVVGCESCHGPARAHVRARREGKADGYGDMAGLGAMEEAQLCGRCHGNREDHRQERAGGSRVFHRTLADRFLRADGTQRLTAYQLGGHLMSECHRVGALQCRHCHDPHSGSPRALDGASAQGDASDRQCTVCHRDRLDPAAAVRHAAHPAKALKCVDCHMAPSWIGDSPEREQHTADHAISVPRPDEARELKLPNACARCHKGRLGGRRGERRPWVVAISRGRGGWADAAGPLLALLQDRSAGTFGQATALELLARLSPNPTLAPALRPWAHRKDPFLRGHALIALSVHDGAPEGPWIRRGLDDGHAVVRMRSFERAQVQMLSERDLSQFLADALNWRQRPAQKDLRRLAEIRIARAEFAEALTVLELAARFASPDERGDPATEELRVRAQRLRDGGVGNRPWAQ